MFERYTESARRALFFARYEASQHGSLSIETEHLLLGLMRAQGPGARVLSRLPLDEIRVDIARRSTFRERVSTSVEMPFSAETKHVLQFAADEADKLQHPHIGTEHLLLALLHDETSLAGSILVVHGFRLHDVRKEIAELSKDEASHERRADAETGNQIVNVLKAAERQFDAMDGAEHIDLIKDIIEHLGRRVALGDDARELVERIRRDLDALKANMK